MHLRWNHNLTKLLTAIFFLA